MPLCATVITLPGLNAVKQGQAIGGGGVGGKHGLGGDEGGEDGGGDNGGVEGGGDDGGTGGGGGKYSLSPQSMLGARESNASHIRGQNDSPITWVRDGIEDQGSIAMPLANLCLVDSSCTRHHHLRRRTRSRRHTRSYCRIRMEAEERAVVMMAEV